MQQMFIIQPLAMHTAVNNLIFTEEEHTFIKVELLNKNVIVKMFS